MFVKECSRCFVSCCQLEHQIYHTPLVETRFFKQVLQCVRFVASSLKSQDQFHRTEEIAVLFTVRHVPSEVNSE